MTGLRFSYYGLHEKYMFLNQNKIIDHSVSNLGELINICSTFEHYIPASASHLSISNDSKCNFIGFLTASQTKQAYFLLIFQTSCITMDVWINR